MKRMLAGHIPLRWLADRRDGVLAGSRAEETERHLATGCATCARSVRQLDGAVAALRAGPLEPAPRPLVRRAARMFREERLVAAFAGVKRLLATLIYDERVQLAVALRAVPGDTRRMLWTFGEHELDACLTTVAGGADFLGTISPAENGGHATVTGWVRAIRGGSEVARADLGPLGRFTFRGLTPGTYVIEGEVDGAPFALPPFLIPKGS